MKFLNLAPVLLMLAIPNVGHSESKPTAFVNADIYPVSSAPIRGGSIIVSKGKITAIGKDIKIPRGATTIDCKGKWITPGLIDSATQLGLTEVSLIRSTVDGSPAWKDPIRAAVQASDALDPRSTVIGVARRHGVTSVVSALRGGLISGQGVWFDLMDGQNQSWIKSQVDTAGMWANLGEAGAGAVGQSRATAVMRFREALDDARFYQSNQSQYRKNALRSLVTSRLDLDALARVSSGKQRLLIHVHRASDIQAVLKLAKTEKLKIALVGAAEGWLVADQIANAGVPVILDPVSNLPSRFDRRNSRSDNAVLLAKAGVNIVISSFSTHNVSSLRFLLGNAVRAGLPWDLALRSATQNPAQVFGQSGRYGTLKKGQRANLVVWTGDPFEPSSWADTVMIRGNLQSTENRQPRLRVS